MTDETCARCPRLAKTVVDDTPLCTRCARKAELEAAEAAAEAAYWEKKFTSRPGQPWRTDPEWQAAMREYLTDIPGENDSDTLVRQMRAIFRIHDAKAKWRAF